MIRADARTRLAWLTLMLAGCSRGAVDLSPARWSSQDFEHYMQLNWSNDPRPLVRSANGMVATTNYPAAVHVGVEALRNGGTAADAIVATTLSQIALDGGAGITYAGQMTVIYFDAKTNKISTMDASWDVPREETDLASIPPMGVPSGRGVLVPGLMKGLGRLHERFGRLPLKALVEPGAFFAEHGFPVDARFARIIEDRAEAITRLPEGKRLFTRTDGQLLQAGDTLRQPELAHTLRQVGAQGVDYVYSGAWAEHLVESVRREGGKLSMEDMKKYDVIWSDGVHTTYRGFDVYGPGLPTLGGVNTVEAFNLLELADLPRLGHYSSSPEALFWLIRIADAYDLIGPPMGGAAVPPEVLRRHLGKVDLSLAARGTKQTAGQVWEHMRGDDWARFEREAREAQKSGADRIESLIAGWRRSPKRVGRTNGLVAIDREGNAAAVMHSINASFFGDVGLFVDGISIPNAGAFQTELMASAGPGGRIPEPDNPVLVLKDGRPFLMTSAVGVGLHVITVQDVLNVLGYDMDPGEAVAQPHFRKAWPSHEPLRQPLGPGEFSRQVLEAAAKKGLKLEIVDSVSEASFAGRWVGIRRNPKTGELEGAASRGGNGFAEGY